MRSSLLRLVAPFALLLTTAGASSVAGQNAEPRVLVFSKTAGFRHGSIAAGIAALQKLGRENGFAVDATEDAAAFAEGNLRRYRAVVFLNTTGDVLTDAQQGTFERYIQAGGGYVGVHSATDTEYDWPWYGRLAGAYFTSHPNNPNVRKGTFRVLDKSHPSTDGLPDRWERVDEFYNFKSLNPAVRVLVDIDEKSYEGGTNGDRHPMSWYHDYDGGRAWYTNMGHTDETYAEPLFLRHLLGGLRYAMGTGALDYGRARPEENRFTKIVLAEKLNEPVELAVLPDERVLFVERRGAIKLWSPATRQITQLGTIPVSLTYAKGAQAEDGLLGLAADPNFAANGWVYMYYSPAGPEAKNVLARFTMRGDSLDMASRVVMLEIPVQRDECCHTGGSIAFDRQGNLYLSTGDNTNPFATGYAPIDERPGRGPWDAQKSSANTNDLRGKIIRIRPEPNGFYTIPAGNLFPSGTLKTRPEIYTMGHRNPYRISVDRRTGFLYWGDVGPDASADSAERGPAGHDEVNQARRAGNFGWPYFVGDNKAYFDVDYATMRAGPRFDPARPRNDSPNNTGLAELPPAQPAFIWYPAGPSAEFPLLGTGGRTAMAGPVYYRDDFRGATRPFPQYYDGKFFAYEWMRGWIIAVTMNASGDLASMERFMPSYKFSNPIDLEFSPVSGDLYMLEYGTGWFQGNPDARLVRIEYNAGNRAPVVAAGADRVAGATPLRVALSSSGTTDADGDSLGYEWTILTTDGTVVRRLTQANPTFTFARPGTYTAALTVTDPQGARATSELQIVAGNEPPKVELDIVGGNRSFFFPGVPIRYAVRVTDREDGSLQSGRIPAQRVMVTAEYRKAGVSPSDTASGHRAAGPAVAAAPAVAHEAGKRLIEGGTCLACHQYERKSIGPSYAAVAQKYKGDTGAPAHLMRKIRQGGKGVWGEVMMPPHPQLSERETGQMVAYIMSLGDAPQGAAGVGSLPTRGTYTPPDSARGSHEGVVVLRAAYTDRGSSGLAGASAEKAVVLRAPALVVASGVLSEGTQKMNVPEAGPFDITLANRSGAHAKFERLDLTGVSAIVFVAMAPAQYQARGGTVEVRLDSATGPLIGQTEMIRPTASPAPTQARAALKPTTGMRDVYFVFRNEDTTAPGMLYVLMMAAFESGAAAGAR
jgi:cytochrome c